MDKGYIHVYTGNGKGKTTAALGVALRTLANGYNVAVAQFIKSRGFDYSELKAFNYINSLDGPLGKIKIDQFGTGCCLHGRKPSDEDFRIIEEGFNKAEEWINSGQYELVILDEINVAIHLGLIQPQKVIELLSHKPAHVEIIITGRHAIPEIIEMADLVTEMKEIKHYYTKGVQSRKGIDF
ncbi:MAG: cob(I)yrinic acid a,c-diamide adenosyltransferase [Muribaculaceae bacterium]|nr:cob(I)yrinic acid a,c-diamide adenosyltransferase [Muribaculaceae bacterium]